MIKIVLDTNVLISGVIVARGHAALILDAIQEGKLDLVVSAFLLEEFGEVIIRPHILNKYPHVSEHADILLDYLRSHTILVNGVPSIPVIADDPDDDYVIACAVEGDADYIVSGDQHLLSLGNYKGIRILSPRQFVDEILKMQSTS